MPESKRNWKQISYSTNWSIKHYIASGFGERTFHTQVDPTQLIIVCCNFIRRAQCAAQMKDITQFTCAREQMWLISIPSCVWENFPLAYTSLKIVQYWFCLFFSISYLVSHLFHHIPIQTWTPGIHIRKVEKNVMFSQSISLLSKIHYYERRQNKTRKTTTHHSNS